MELPLVLRDKETKTMRLILLRKEKENSVGNMIIPSSTEVRNQGIILSDFYSFSSSFFFLCFPHISHLSH